MKIFNVNVYFCRNNSCHTQSYFLIRAYTYDDALNTFLDLVKNHVFDDGIDIDDFEDWNFTAVGDYSELTRMKLYKNEHGLRIAVINGTINDVDYQYITTERG
jgi:hypothetical protein